MRRALVLLVVLAAMRPVPASAQFYTGNKVYTECTADENAATYNVARALCLGFVVGVYDVVVPLIRSSGESALCVPDGVTLGQVTDVVIKYLRDNPAKRNNPAASLVTEALLEAWP